MNLPIAPKKRSFIDLLEYGRVQPAEGAAPPNSETYYSNPNLRLKGGNVKKVKQHLPRMYDRSLTPHDLAKLNAFSPPDGQKD